MSPASGTEEDAETLGRDLPRLEPGVAASQVGGTEAQLLDPVCHAQKPPAGSVGDERLRIEPLDDRADLGGAAGDVEAADGADAALPTTEGVEDAVRVVAQGGDDTEPGDGDAPPAKSGHGRGRSAMDGRGGRTGGAERDDGPLQSGGEALERPAVDRH